jgi:hypothetical protein
MHVKNNPAIVNLYKKVNEPLSIQISCSEMLTSSILIINSKNSVLRFATNIVDASLPNKAKMPMGVIGTFDSTAALFLLLIFFMRH